MANAYDVVAAALLSVPITLAVSVLGKTRGTVLALERAAQALAVKPGGSRSNFRLCEPVITRSLVEGNCVAVEAMCVKIDALVAVLELLEMSLRTSSLSLSHCV